MNFDWSKYFNTETIEKILRIAIILVVGLIIIYTIAHIVKKLLPQKLSQQRKMIINRFVQYSGFITLLLIIVSELNTNVTRFPIRRLDFDLSVAYKEDLEKVKQVLLRIVKRNPLCLDEPEPIVVF